MDQDGRPDPRPDLAATGHASPNRITGRRPSARPVRPEQRRSIDEAGVTDAIDWIERIALALAHVLDDES
ncbi:hypothetical protein ACFYRD_09690 [Streptomyces hirsutus]|uniref:hypothetical protein n=1 Tax=Streptomyces hirsutus TaxID=35620 RepID=UPI0036987058